MIGTVILLALPSINRATMLTTLSNLFLFVFKTKAYVMSAKTRQGTDPGQDKLAFLSKNDNVVTTTIITMSSLSSSMTPNLPKAVLSQ